MKPKFKKILRFLIDIVKEEVLVELEQKNNSIDIISNDLDEPMTTLEVIDYYNISLSTLNRYVREGLKRQSKGKGCKNFYTKREFNYFITKTKKNKKWIK